jgi:hypothetical protein
LSTGMSEIEADDFGFVYLDVDFLPIAWLVYRGVLNSPDITSANPGNLSWFQVNGIKRGSSAWLRREGVLEGYRRREFRHCISRLTCVFAYPNLDAAKQGAYSSKNSHPEDLVSIAPASDDFRREEYDGQWIDDFDSLPPKTARRYWVGEVTAAPRIEMLLQGRFWILGTSVRKRSYETIKSHMPDTLAMLELSRLGVEFGSEIGSISPWLVRDRNKLVVRFIIRYDETEGIAVLRKALDKKARCPEFQINLADLQPLLDSSPSREMDALFSCPDMRPFEHEFRLENFAKLTQYVDLLPTE